MTKLTPHQSLRPDTELVAEFQKEYTFKGSIQVQRGLILHAVYIAENRAEPVKITSSAQIALDGKSATHQHKATFDPQAVYVWAINRQRALIKVQRMLQKFIENRHNKTKS